MDTPSGVEHDPRVSPQLPEPGSMRPTWNADQVEAVRLATLHSVSHVRSMCREGIDCTGEAEAELDFQLLVAGLRKVVAAGAEAKRLADVLVRQYGPEASGLW